MTKDSSKQVPNCISGSSVLSQITDPVIAIDFEGRVLFWNQGAERQYGRTSDEMLGQTLSAAYHPQWLHGEDESALLEDIRRTGKGIGETLHILPDGRQMLVEFQSYLLRNDQGKEIGVIASIRDVTSSRQRDMDRIAAEKRSRDEAQEQWMQLRNNGGVLESFLENLPVSAYVKDEQGRHIFHNRVMRVDSQLATGIAGKTDEELFGSETGRQYRENDLDALRSGKPIQTLESITIAGVERSFISVKFPIVDEKGSLYVGGVSVDITENIRDQAELRKRSALLDLANDAIFLTELDGTITYWNLGAERLYGWTAAEAIGKEDRELLRAAFPTAYSKILKLFLRDGHWGGEVKNHRNGGEPLTVSSRWSLLRDLDGTPVARMVINTDQTEAKIAFDELRRAEAEAQARATELTAILDAIPGATFIAHDPECRSMTSSRAACDLLRLPRGANSSKSALPEELPTTFRVMRDGRELAPEELPVQQAASTGRPVLDAEVTIVFGDGTSRDLLGNAEPLLDGAGAVRGAVGAFIDVTERNLDERSSRQREAILRAVLDGTPDFVFLKDCDGRYLAINAAGARAAGKTQDQILGKDDNAIFPPETAAQYMRRDREVIASGKSATFDEEIPIAGQTRQIHTVKNVCREADGRIIGLVGFSRDITERKRLETALRQREHELTEAHRIARLGIWHWNIATDTVTWSSELYHTFGLEPDLPAPRYNTLGQFFTAESWARLQDAVKRAIEAGEPYELDLEITRPDGTTRWITGRGEVETYLNGEVVQLRGTLQEITERKRKEEQLTLSEARYRSLVHASSSIVWTTNPQGLALEDLASWRSFTGQTAEEVAGFGTADSIHPEDRERTLVAMKEAINSGKDYEIEHRIRRYDGVYRAMSARAVPVRDAAGTIVEWVGMHTDITERKLTEETLRESDSRFRKLFDSGLMGICIPDRFGAFTEGNDELLRITGYTREDLNAGRVRWDTMTPPEYQTMDVDHIAEAAQRGSCTPYEKEYIRKDGSRVPILCGYALLEGSQNEYIGFVQDMTAQKKAEAALIEREQRFRVLAESLPQFVWVTDANGEKTYCNQKYMQYAGASSLEMMDLKWTSLLHPQDLEPTLQTWKRSLETGEPYENAYRLARHDGVYRHFLARAVPVRNEAGQIEQWLGSSTDVHDQKLVEMAMRRSEKLATAGRFAASIAHEINNPLASVTNALYLALQDRSLNEATLGYLRLADQELARVAQVTTQTLRFHKQSTAPGAVDVSAIMESVISVSANKFAVQSISVVREYRTRETLYCYGDELRQVFANLLGNSLDAMAQEGRLHIRIKETHAWDSAHTRGIKVIVADTGEGIPIGLRKQVFEPFFSTKDATGTGLGLWVAEGIIRKHHGRIALRSRTEAHSHGTVFSIFIPFTGISE